MSTRPRSRGRTLGAAQALALLLSFVLVAGVGGVLAAGLALPAVALANSATDLSVQAFDDLPTELEPGALPQKSVILAADGTLLATFFDQNRVVVPLSEIAPIMQKAVIAIEDKRFYEHAGIDPQGMVRAAAKGLLGVGKEGASTLTQQYVKNVLIEQALAIEDPTQQAAALAAAKENDGPEGYARKLREAKLAIALEKRMTKEQILEGYLNIAQFGRSSIYGVESAAQYFFRKSAKDLNYLEAATIAGVTQSPTKWDPELNPHNSQNRRNVVLKTMYDQGYITQQEYSDGVSTPIESTLNITPIRQGCMAAGEKVAGSGFFCDYVTKILLNDTAFGADLATRKRNLYKGGLTITTTLIPAEQQIADAEVKAGVPVDDPSGVGSAIVSVEPGTGKVTSMAQNRNYTAVQNAGPTETSVNWNTTNEYGSASGFAPGSTFKPFTLVEWLKQGHSLTQTFDGARKPMNQNSFTACGAPYSVNGMWTPRNSEGQGGVMNAIDATRNSVNSAYLAMAQQLDLCAIMQDAADLGVQKAGGKSGTGNIDAKPANVIGSDSVAPLSMAAAFAAFAADGVYCVPIAITSVVDANGTSLPVPPTNCQQKLDPDIARGVNYTLKNVWTGTAKAVGNPGFPAAGKTGTTSENEENWFVGYTPLKATAVWVGHPDRWYSMGGQTINGHRYTSGPYGSSIAAPTWKRFMVQAMGGLSVPGFTTPSDRIINGEKVSVPNVVGMSQDAAKAKLEAASFQVKIDPTAVSSDLPAGTVVAQNPSGTSTKYSVVMLTVSNGVPPVIVPDPGVGPFPGGPDPGGRGNPPKPNGTGG